MATLAFRLYPTNLFLLTLLILLIGLSNPSLANRFENLSIEDGLSQNTVFDMKQDRYGRLWMATYDGLNLYDGNQFIHFSSKPNQHNDQSLLSSSTVYDITIDQSGNLWLSTRVGLTHLDIDSFKTQHFPHDPNNANSLSSNALRYSILDSNGYLWVASDTGLNRYDIKNQTFTHYKDQPNNKEMHKCPQMLQALLEDTQGYIWVGGSTSGLCRFNPKTKEFIQIDYRNNKKESASTGIRHLYQETPNEIWIGSTNGLFLYNIETNRSTAFFSNPNNDHSLSHNWIQKIAQHDEDHLWIATSGGLNLFNKKTSRFQNFVQQPNQKFGLSSDNLYCVFQDKSGLVWIGTENAGVDKYNPRQTQFIVKNQTLAKGYRLSNNAVWSVIKAYGYIWMATAGGLNRLDPNTGKIKIYQHDPNDKNSILTNNIYRVAAAKNRNIWITSSNGIARLDIDLEQFTNYQHDINDPSSIPFNNIISIAVMPNDDIWLGSYGEGLALVNFERNKNIHYLHDPKNPSSIISNFIHDIVVHKDEIWLSTRVGINRYIQDTDSFERIGKNILPEDFPTSTLRIRENNDIMITSANGLYILEQKTGKLKKYGVQNGLSNDHLYSLEEDGSGNIWVGSNFGLSKINLETDEIINFDTFDGLQGYEFNSAASYNDGEYLYFGGFEGLNYFKPEDVVISDYVPPVIVTKFSTPGKEFNAADLKQTVNISYKDTYFSIEFAALDYTAPKKNRYLYKLKGYDTDWVDSGNRNYAAYTNLDGGEYSFHVKAANKYGIWNNAGASIDIQVTPPYWETEWFRLMIATSLVIFIFLAYRIRVKAIHSYNKVLEEQVQSRTADLERTLLELGETKDALIESAHKAGMADSATGVLHNVGNLLNSVNTSANIIRDTVEGSIINKFLRANELLIKNLNNIHDFIQNDPKGKTLLTYYAELDIPFRSEQKQLHQNANRLIKSITSIKETIAAQHRYAKGHQLIEEVSVIDLINDTLLLQSGSINRHEIKIHKLFDSSIPKLMLQKIKLVQILLNLYKNAKESMDEHSNAENHLTIKYYRDDKFAYIKLSDTGVGIDTDKLEKIFAYGYSTKAGGNGFGLHSCANYMTEMGGEMWAESQGYGHGASFTLKFPLQQTQVEPQLKAG